MLKNADGFNKTMLFMTTQSASDIILPEIHKLGSL